MRCNHCGTQFEDTLLSCPNCGAPAGNPGQAPYMQNPAHDQASPCAYPQMLSKREFLKHENVKKITASITAAAVGLYICAGISLIAALLSGMSFMSLDVALILGLGLGIHLAQSRVCSILICIYSVINVIVLLMQTGRLSGWLIVLAAFSALFATFKFQAAWAKYQKTGILPAAF